MVLSRYASLLVVSVGLSCVVACSSPELGGTPNVLFVSVADGPRVLAVGSTLVLSASVVGVGGASEAVSWSSSNSSVATIGRSTGVATGVSGGSTTMTATSIDDDSRTASVSLTVVESAPMILTIDTRLGPGTTVHLSSMGAFDVTVQWGDGSSSSATTGSGLSHTYPDEGVYEARISGSLTHFGGGDRLVGVIAWGDVGLISLSNVGRGVRSLPASLPSSVTDLSHMFFRSEFDGDISGWDTSNVTNMEWMFAESTFNGDIGAWDVSGVVTMESMFLGASAFDRPIGGWDVSKVMSMRQMFSGGDDWIPFNQDIGDWNVSNVTDMSAMFEWNDYDQDLGRWDVSSVTSMRGMFWMSSFNRDISAWDVANVTDMSGMFGNAGFNQGIGAWDVSSVVTMAGMFAGVDESVFNQDIGAWDVSKVSDMSGMFANEVFDHDIGGWDVSSVVSMARMFEGNAAFDQDIGEWNVSAAINMDSMFEGASAFNQDLSRWCVANIPTEPEWFAVRATSWTLPQPAWGTCAEAPGSAWR